MTTRKHSTSILRAGLLLIAMFLCSFSSSTVSALGQDIVTKSEMSAVYECYKEGNMRTPIDSWEWKNKGASVLGTTGTTVSLLTTTTGTATYTSCSNLFNTTFSSKMPAKNASSADLENFMKKMGYEIEKTGDGGVCATYSFAGSSAGSFKLCAPAAGTEPPYTMGNSIITVEYNGQPVSVTIGKYLGHPTVTVRCGDSSAKICSEAYTDSNTSFSDLAQEVFNEIGEFVADSKPGWYLSGSQAEVSAAGSDNRFTLNNPGQGAVSAINYLYGKSMTSEVQVNPTLSLGLSEQKVALQDALNNYFHIMYFGGSTSSACNLSGTAESNATAQGYIKLKTDASTTCYVAASTHANDKIPLFNTTTKMPDATQLSFSEVVQATSNYVTGAESLGENPSLELTPTDPGTNPDTPSNPDGSNEDNVSEITACYKNAGVLGWILCPVLETMSNVVDGLYGYLEKNFLQVNSSIMQSSGVNEGWKQFRNAANILFAIFFAVLIFAQVTGIGITNYNIKKILPRLLMVVVLVNVSFILCELAVDVSNILGAGLRSMFEGFADTAAKASGGVPFNLGTVVGGAIASLFTVGGAVGITAVFAITIPWELWLFPFFLAIIGCIVSIFFFFLTLGVRQAGVIIMITLAPLAIVCYALPNTKPLFDKWRKLFTALLMVYPICGLLMGGGQFASTLLLIAGNQAEAGAFFTIVAMLLSVVPFFAIPTILRSSMNGMSGLGMRISQFGKGLSGRLQGGIRHSEFGREAQRQANMSYASRAVKKIESKADANGELSKKQQIRRGRYVGMHNRLMFDEIRAGGNQELLTRGSSGYNALVGKEQRAQAKADIEGRQNIIKSGAMQRIAAGHEGEMLNGNDDSAMQEELDAYLDKIITNSDGDEKTAEYVKNAQAIINTFSDSKSGGARARVVNSLSDAMFRNQATLTNTANKQRLTSTFGKLGEQTRDSYGADYKKDHPGSMALLSDLAKGDFSHAGDFTEVVHEIDIDGNPNGKTHRRSKLYSQAGLTGMTVEDFSKLKANGASNILDAMRKGEISGGSVSALAGMADKVLNSNTFTPDEDVKPYLEQIRNAAFSNRVLPTGSTRASGSTAISKADSSALTTIVDRLQSAPDSWGGLTADQQQEYGNLISNVQEAMQHDSFTQENAQILQQAMSVAKAKGFQNAQGHVVTDATIPKITENRIKINHNQPIPKPIEEQAYPGGLTRSTAMRSTRNGRQTEVIWKDSSGARVTDQALIDQAEEIYRINQDIRKQNAMNGFNPFAGGGSGGSSGSGGSGGGSGGSGGGSGGSGGSGGGGTP